MCMRGGVVVWVTVFFFFGDPQKSEAVLNIYFHMYICTYICKFLLDQFIIFFFCGKSNLLKK